MINISVSNTSVVRNKYIDVVKLFACLGVVFGHSMGGDEGIAGFIAVIGSFAVPYFFLVSGYFSEAGLRDNWYIIKRIKHLLIILLMGFVLCGMWEIISLMVLRTSYFDFSMKVIVHFLIFNECKFFGSSQPLWFIAALIYIYIIFFCRNKLCYKEIFDENGQMTFNDMVMNGLLMSRGGIRLLIFPSFLLLGMYVMEVFSLPNYFYRNFLFDGMPFFLFGVFIKKYNESILKKVKSRLILCLVLVGIIEIFISRFYFDRLIDCYLGTLLVSIGLFVLALKAGMKVQDVRLLRHFNKDVSMYIYLTHLYFLVATGFVFMIMHFGVEILKPIVAFILAYIFGWFFDEFRISVFKTSKMRMKKEKL